MGLISADQLGSADWRSPTLKMTGRPASERYYYENDGTIVFWRRMGVTPHIMEVHRVTRIAENCAKELEPDFTLTLDPAQPHYPSRFPRWSPGADVAYGGDLFYQPSL